MLCRNSAHSGTYRSAFFKYENAVFNGEQEKESIFCAKSITHDNGQPSATFVIPNHDPLDGLFYLTIGLLMSDSYIFVRNKV